MACHIGSNDRIFIHKPILGTRPSGLMYLPTAPVAAFRPGSLAGWPGWCRNVSYCATVPRCHVTEATLNWSTDFTTTTQRMFIRQDFCVHKLSLCTGLGWELLLNIKGRVVKNSSWFFWKIEQLLTSWGYQKMCQFEFLFLEFRSSFKRQIFG